MTCFGWIMPRPDKFKPEKMIGGAAALKSVIRKDLGPKLVLDAGDWWQGAPEGSLSKGAGMVDIFNAIGFDALEIGNHDFDAGTDHLRSLIGRLQMPVLAANLYGPDGQHVPWVRQRVIKVVGGVKFGIFGLITSRLPKLSYPKNIAGLTVRREADEARDQVQALKKEGAEIIVAVTHVGLEQPDMPRIEGDQTIAAQVTGIDLIVGGHTHNALTRAWLDPVNGTRVVQAGLYLTKVGHTTLTIDPKTHRLLDVKEELIDLWPDQVGEDNSIKKLVGGLQSQVGDGFKVVIATATKALLRGDLGEESGLGSWMADCYKDWAGTEVALQNGGGMRADIVAGPVTVRDIFNVMPFDNTMVKLKVEGRQLRTVLDHGVGGPPRLVQVAGITAEYSRLRPKNQRLGAVTVAGLPLEDKKTYSLATIDYLISGGDGYSKFDQSSTEMTGVLARDVLRSCAEKQKMIAPPPAGRLKRKGD
jgi:2',3'-cyclic-nucleotide 2'-phosphodiesterase (5'-nucleotidase family)